MQQRVGEFLRAKAHKTGSRILLAVAKRIAADPMKKVKKMIQDMIVKMNEEAAAEADAKGNCDVQLGTNKESSNFIAILYQFHSRAGRGHAPPGCAGLGGPAAAWRFVYILYRFLYVRIYVDMF